VRTVVIEKEQGVGIGAIHAVATDAIMWLFNPNWDL